MERFSRRESILLGYNLQNHRSSTNPSTPNRNSDIDFHDVFGGPPRRSSIQEMRYNVRESQDLSIVEREDEEAAASCAWPRVSEKPVFGEEIASWRRYPSNDFFDDIFGGDESQSSTPRRRERDHFSASRVSSPARPLPPKAEPFGPSSLPAAFSLPAKLTNGTELPTFGFPTSTSTRTLKNGNSNGLNSWDSPATPLSRFSSQAGQGTEGFKNDPRPSSGPNLLSQDKADKEINLEQNSSTCEVAPSNGQFHFSIYKWASKGVPLAMPFRTERNSRTKEKVKMERSSSAKERLVSENTIQNDSLLRSSLMKSRKQEEGLTYISSQNGASMQETAPAKTQSITLSSLPSVVEDVPRNVMSHKSSHSVSEIGLPEKSKEESIYPNPIHKPRSLHTLFNESVDKQHLGEMHTSHMEKESKAKSLFEWSVQISVNPKKREETTVAMSGVEVGGKNISQDSSGLDDNLGNGRVKGKVKEFVRIFNQEPSTKPGIYNKSRTQGSEYTHKGVLRTKNEVEDCSEKSKKEDPGIGTASKSGYGQDEIPASGAAVPDSSDVAVGDKDESFHGNFLIKELNQDKNEVLQRQNSEEIEVIDTKIRQWSNGKEGNIRSLLSTLQYVLWPDSGWKPVPLVDIIEGNAVKRTYQRALLCLHPDKLQQKGATSHQKYIAEKVYDILQEAWTHFNMLGEV